MRKMVCIEHPATVLMGFRDGPEQGRVDQVHKKAGVQREGPQGQPMGAFFAQGLFGVYFFYFTNDWLGEADEIAHTSSFTTGSESLRSGGSTSPLIVSMRRSPGRP